MVPQKNAALSSILLMGHWLPMQESFPAAIRASDEADYESAGQD
jgi:hypothetical protein